MTALRRFGTFWWDFVVGDDWRVAAALVVTGLVASWWVLPPAVALVLTVSLLRATRRGF